MFNLYRGVDVSLQTDEQLIARLVFECLPTCTPENCDAKQLRDRFNQLRDLKQDIIADLDSWGMACAISDGDEGTRREGVRAVADSVRSILLGGPRA